MFGNQSGEHFIDIFSTTSSADFLGQLVAIKYVGVFSRLCITEALGSFSKQKQVRMCSSMLGSHVGALTSLMSYLRKIIFWGSLYVRREERKDLVGICKYTAHGKEARSKTLALLCSFCRSVLTKYNYIHPIVT